MSLQNQTCGSALSANGTKTNGNATTEQTAHNPLCSVVIPTYNRAEMMCECAASVLAGDYENIEVIIVDDASPDNTGDLARARFGHDKRVKYIRNRENLGQAGSRNAGAGAASGELLMFLDDDNAADAGMIRMLAGCFSGRPELGLVAPLSIQGKNDTIWTLGSSYDFTTSRPVNLSEGMKPGDVKIEDRLYGTMYSPNAFMIKRSAWEAIGGFDTKFHAIYEEADIGYRIAKAGYSCAIYPLARTLHRSFLEPGSVTKLRYLGIETPMRTYYFARNRSIFAKRHFPKRYLPGLFCVFIPLSAVYYCFTAIRCGRLDIAWMYLKGTVTGIFMKPWDPPR